MSDAVTKPRNRRRRVVMPLAGPLRETDHVLGHELHSLDEPTSPAGEAPSPEVAGLNAGVFPPRDRAEGLIATDLMKPAVGIVPGSRFQTRPYRAKLRLDYVAPPSIGLNLGNKLHCAAGRDRAVLRCGRRLESPAIGPAARGSEHGGVA